eukprot:2104509-Prymnesium_polylepis.1
MKRLTSIDPITIVHSTPHRPLDPPAHLRHICALRRTFLHNPGNRPPLRLPPPGLWAKRRLLTSLHPRTPLLV